MPNDKPTNDKPTNDTDNALSNPDMVSGEVLLPGELGSPAPNQRDMEVDQNNDADSEETESVRHPGKVMRIGSMIKMLLDEVRQAPLDEKGRSRLREIYEQSLRDLSDGLSPDLAAELDRMTLPFDDQIPSEAELRIAQAQLVGWLEGLFHGIQATLMAQQMAARAQLEDLRQRSLPPGPDASSSRPGAYL